MSSAAGEPRPTDSGQQASGILHQVRQKAATQLNEQKARATDSLGSVADAVRQSTRQLRDQQFDTVAQVVERAADQIERLSNHLRDRDLNELVAEAQQFARQQPAMFIGSSFAAGLLAARFIKASRPSESYGHRAYVSTGGGETFAGSVGSERGTYGKTSRSASSSASSRATPPISCGKRCSWRAPNCLHARRARPVTRSTSRSADSWPTPACSPLSRRW
jgi:hypothetical protein